MSEEYFVNRKEAHVWLEENGFVVSSGKFYADCKKGFPAVNPDKTVSKYQVAVYGQKLKKENTPDLSAVERSSDDHRKAKADANIAEMKDRRMQREEDDLWLHADVAWSAIAGLMGELRRAIRHYHNQESSAFVLAAGGEASRAPEVFEMMEAATDKAFNEVAGKKIEISFKDGE